MAAGSKKRRRRNPATRLTDDLIVEILSRLPVKSICRFKCVSKHWCGLISHPEHGKKLPQTLAGFFYNTISDERFPESARHFTNVTGWGAPQIRPSLPFLPGDADIEILDSCNGLVLCRSFTAAGAVRYVVCNPATEEWAALPESSQGGKICNARLGFDPAVSPHFHVFEFVETDVDPGYVSIDGLEIYSSKTGEWAFRGSGWGAIWRRTSRLLISVFLNGFLHVFESYSQNVLVVDTEGKAWRRIPLPWLNTYYGNTTFIGRSQGHLYCLNSFEDEDSEYLDFKVKVFALEDCASDNWVLKHSVKASKLAGRRGGGPFHCPIAIHPEGNLIFFISYSDHTIRCYDMDCRKVHVIRNMECTYDWRKQCLPYVPLFSESSVAGIRKNRGQPGI